GSFSFTVCGALPETAWQHVLANGRMGFLTTDAGTGFMWYENAREGRISPWENDHLKTCGAEDIRVAANGRTASLFAREDGFLCRVTYGFGWASWEKDFGVFRTKLLAFVPPEKDVRVLKIEAEGDLTGARLVYSLRLALGNGEASPLIIRREGKRVVAENPCRREFPAPFVTETGEDFEMLSREGGEEFIRLSLPPKNQTVLSGTGFEAFDADGAFEETVSYWKRITGAVRIKTPESKLDDYINGWGIY
ncbi:MAG: hypothetical protein IKR21_03520, partial [Oscillospiraceae bacterium]|nr:hypothetical protein [Oscillospiraceae bacterium]